MDELKVIDKFKIINTLKEGKILISVQNKLKTFFKYKNGFIYVKNNQSSYYLDINDFNELYMINTFYLYENNDEDEIDFEKDVLYYSLDNKKL